MSASERTTPPTELELSNLNPEHAENPAPLFAWTREHAPALQGAIYKQQIFLTRYEDVRAMLMDKSLSADPMKQLPGLPRRVIFERGPKTRASSILFLDDPKHRQLKGIVSRAFTSARVEEQRGDIEAVVERLLDGCAGKAGFDVMSALAIPLPVIVIARFLGVPETDMADFRRWSAAAVESLNSFADESTMETVRRELAEMSDYFVGQVEARRRAPGADLLSAMVQAEEDGARMTTDEIVAMCNTLLVAGNVTTTDLIGNGVLRLLRAPDQLALLRADWGLAANAVEELLRLESPIAVLGRSATADGAVHGCPYHAGHSLVGSLTSANLDPAKHEDPERFDITREKIEHIAFGLGSHFCLGAPLARLETRIALTRLFQRFPNLRLAPEGYKRKAAPAFRGLDELHVLA